MTSRALNGLSAALAVACVLAAVVPLAGQTGGVPALVITAFGDKPAPAYTMPRMPWGDPDLQGVWSSDDTAGIPLSRPQQFANRLYMTDEEYANRQKQVDRGIEAAENAEGSFRGDFARRAFHQTSLVIDPPDGRMPAVTAQAKLRAAPRDRGTFGDGPFNSTEDFTLYDRCITRGVVGSVLRVIYGNGNRIVQGPGMVAISYEMIHDTRVFYTDGRPHINQAIRQYLGDSRARWDGDMLVVETTNLTDKTSIGLNGNGLRHSDRMKITERFKRVAPDVIQYQVTVDDPVTYEKPFTISMPGRRSTAASSCPTSATKATTRSGSRSAPSAPRTRRWQPIWPKGSSARAGRCKTAWASAASRSVRAARAAAAGEARGLAARHPAPVSNLARPASLGSV